MEFFFDIALMISKVSFTTGKQARNMATVKITQEQSVDEKELNFRNAPTKSI